MIQNKILIFDLGDVIINLKPEIQWWQEDLLPNFNQDKLTHLFHHKYFHDFEKGKISNEEFLEKMNSIKTNTQVNVEQLWCGILKNIPQHRLDLLYEISKFNEIYLLSNTNDIHINYIFENELAGDRQNMFNHIFKKQYYSQKIGMRKPDAEIYQFINQEVQKPNIPILFFDDKIENLAFPAQIGWQTHLVNQDISILLDKIN